VDKLRRELSGATISGIPADLSSGQGCEKLIDQLPEIDVLVNNLGIFEPTSFEQISDEDWIRFFETNVLSGVRLSRHYVRGMRSRNWGRIVFVSSESALQIPTEMIHYGVTKTAQLAVARGLADSAGVLLGRLRRQLGGLVQQAGHVRCFRHLAPQSATARYRWSRSSQSSG